MYRSTWITMYSLQRYEFFTRQAICYPSRRDTIFEAVRNYQRVHLKICPLIPPVIMDEYNKLSYIDADALPRHKSNMYLNYTMQRQQVNLESLILQLIIIRDRYWYLMNQVLIQVAYQVNDYKLLLRQLNHHPSWHLFALLVVGGHLSH